MKTRLLAAVAVIGLAASAGAAGAATFYGPSAYTSQADAPFQAGDFNNYHYLEDVEDGAINTPGITVTGLALCISGTACFVGTNFIDSVGNGGNGFTGHSIFAAGSVQIDFSAAALGGLPTFAGLVWTDGFNPINFQAFDENGILLGSLAGSHADNSITGTLADDRFYGVTHAGGISRLTITNTPGTEIDHIQYGRSSAVGAAIPEPATWALMILGFGAVGGLARRDARARRLAAA